MKVEVFMDGHPAGTVTVERGILEVTDSRLRLALAVAAVAGPLWHPDGRPVPLGPITTKRQAQAAMESANIANGSPWIYRIIDPVEHEAPPNDLDVE
jgi:hypothetical protein